MKYFIIAGEASGDLHGSQLIRELRDADSDAEFRFLGGDLMAQQAGVAPIVHYRDMAYMGFVEVAKHLRTILGFLKTAKTAIGEFQPDAVILIDYPSFNLKVAEFAHDRSVPVFYFISPKVWAWKEFRVKKIKRWVDDMFCILPFEVDFYRKHDFEVDYVGNPTVKEIAGAIESFGSEDDFYARHGLKAESPIIALVPGSRRKEIRDNLPTMIAASESMPDCPVMIAGAPGIEDEFYEQHMGGATLPVIMGETFEVIYRAKVALVTSGTATLETALLGTPQVACYRMNGSKWLYRFYRMLIKGNFVTLPNLITNRAIIPELLLHDCSVENVIARLKALADGPDREQMLRDYESLKKCLGDNDCAKSTAAKIIARLKKS